MMQRMIDVLIKTLGLMTVAGVVITVMIPEYTQLHAGQRPLMLVLATLLVVVLFHKELRAAMPDVSADTKNLVLVSILALVPAAVFLLQLLPAVQGEWRTNGLRLLFVVVLSFLPGALYYSSAATRRLSALNELIVLLHQFRLVPGDNSHPRTSKRRVEAYIEQFEALYGLLSNRDTFMRELFSGGIFERCQLHGIEREFQFHSAGILRAMPRPLLVHLGLVVSLMAIGWAVVLPPVSPTAIAPLTNPLAPDLTLFNASFVGAYIYVLVTMMARWVRHDLNAQACITASKQIAFAMLCATVLKILSPGTPPAGTGDLMKTGRDLATLFMALCIGVFPNQLLHMITERFQSRLTRRRGGNIKTASLQALDGVNLWHEARLQEECVDDLHALCHADIVELTLKTRMHTDLLVEWVDQALLKAPLGQETQLLGKLSSICVTTATELVAMLAARATEADLTRRNTLTKKELVTLEGLASSFCRRYASFRDVDAWRRPAQIAPLFPNPRQCGPKGPNFYAV